MHKENFKKIQIETEKIIKETQNVIDDLIDQENKSKNKSEVKENKKTLSIENLTKHQETLVAEAQKIKNLEYVVAVVGTMKAGKSMTINAIVGQEVLPSREHPMTTLPTLITHVPKQTEPKLVIQKVEPFEKLRDEIKIKTSNHINVNDDIKSLLSRIQNGTITFETEYNGQSEISNFLKDINDLMRVAKELDIEPPYEEYTNVDDLPRIEVEFYHLSKYTQEASEAKLTLLDTPGPDEFKQSDVLKTIFQEQLRKSSAVTLVVDYTKMNNESDVEVKEQLKEAAEMIGEKHLFVLLNKFDLRNRDKEENVQKEEARRLISEGVLKGKIKEKHIYPVGAKQAFYANLGLCELAKNKKIDQGIPWINSFGNVIAGDSWDFIKDKPEIVLSACKKSWEKSYLEDPLNNIIATIHSDALILALESPLEKLQYILKEVLLNGLKARQVGYEEDIKKLQGNIVELKKDIENVSRISKKLQEETQKQLSDIEEDILQKTEEYLQNTKQQILDVFEEKLESIEQREQNNKSKEKPKNWWNKPVWEGGLLGGSQYKEDEKKRFKDYIEKMRKEGKIEFNSKEKADEFKQKIIEQLDNLIGSILLESNKLYKERVQHLIPSLNEKIKNELGELIKIIEQRMGGEIEITLQQIKFLDDNISVKKNFNEIVQLETLERKRSVVGEGLFNKALNWINNDWGRETESYSEEIYEIFNKDINQKVGSVFEEVSTFIKTNANHVYTKMIQEVVSEVIQDLINEIEEYRAEVIDALKKREDNEVNTEIEISLAEEQIKKVSKLNKRIIHTKQALDQANGN